MSDLKEKAEGLHRDFPHGPLAEQWEVILLAAQAEALEEAAGVICEWTRTCRSNNCRCRVLRDRAARLRREAEGK